MSPRSWCAGARALGDRSASAATSLVDADAAEALHTVFKCRCSELDRVNVAPQ
jgi:hypothetical protein